MSLDDILAGINNPDPKIRQETIRSLVRARASGTTKLLRQVAAQDPDPDVRTLAAGAVEYLTRQSDAPRRRRSDGGLPEISNEDLHRKEARAHKDELSLVEYAMLGFIALLVIGLFIILIANGIKVVIEGKGGDSEAHPRDAIVRDMRQAIDEARDIAVQLQQLPELIRATPDGVACSALPDIPATYFRSDAEIETYPEVDNPKWAIHRARNAINTAEERWRRYCEQSGGRLTNAPDKFVAQSEDLLAGGMKALDEATRYLDALSPPSTPTP